LIHLNAKVGKFAKVRPRPTAGRHVSETSQATGQVIFRCPAKEEEFDSGFRAKLGDLTFLPAGATIRLRCRVCGDVHTFQFSAARIAIAPGR